MKKRLFTGAGTAIITPMHQDGSVDYESFGRFIDWQIDHGVDANGGACTAFVSGDMVESLAKIMGAEPVGRRDTSLRLKLL